MSIRTPGYEALCELSERCWCFVCIRKDFESRIAQVCSMLQAIQEKEHLIAHMKSSYHSVHQPQLWCPLAKGNCSNFLLKEVAGLYENFRQHRHSQGTPVNMLPNCPYSPYCELIGGGSDGTLNLCVRVCLVDEDEKLIFHTYVLPQILVTNYRYEITGITKDHLRDAMPLKECKIRFFRFSTTGNQLSSQAYGFEFLRQMHQSFSF